MFPHSSVFFAPRPRKKSYCRRIVSAWAALTAIASAADGPGISNQAYDPSRAGEILSIIDPQKAVSATAVHRGYLFVPLGADHGGGQGAGAFAFYDVSNPSSPANIFDSRSDTARYHTSGTLDYVGNWAEVHHLPVSGDLMMISERRNGSAGIAIFDTAPLFDEDPATKPRTISRFSFPGVTSPSNYDGYSFALGWQGRRYVYAPTGAQGLYVVDTTNLSNPVLLSQISYASLGGVTLRAAWPIGNMLIMAEGNVQSSFQARIYDISNPANPVQTGSFSGPFGYHGFIYGSSFYGGGSPIARHDFTNPANVVRTDLYPNPDFDRPEYGYAKDGHLYIGHYPGATKWKLNGNTAEPAGRVNSGLVDDHAFLNPLGNLVILCSDHNNNRKMMIGVHAAERDTEAPQALFTSPANGATNQNVLSRVGISFSDFIDPISVNSSTMIVRKLSTGQAVPGTYSAMMGIVNFAPDAPLDANTTYDVMLMANGVKDQVGNAVPEEIRVARFSTGSQLSDYSVAMAATTPKQTGVTANFAANVTNTTGLTLEHSWDFGDGSPQTAFSTSTTASHAYAAPGNYAVSVRTRIQGQTYAPAVNGIQVVHRSIPSTAPVAQSTIVLDPSRALVWNVNKDTDSVSAINTSNHIRTREVTVGTKPTSLAIAPNDHLWVVNKESASITVINRATGAITATYPLPTGSAPHGIVIDTTEGFAYVTLEAFGQVAKIQTSNGAIVSSVFVGPWSRGMALDRSRQKLWVSRFISPDDGGKVTPVDLASFTAGSPVLLAPVMNSDSLQNGRGIPNYLAAPVLSPDLSHGFIPSKKDNIFRGEQRDGLPLTFEHTVRSMAANLNLSTGVEDATMRIDFDNSDFAAAGVFSPLGNRVYFATSGSTTIWVVDAYRPTSSSFSFDSGGLAPDGMVMSADGSRLYIHNFMDRSVTVFQTDASNGTMPLLAKVNTIATEKLTAQVLRGKQLFYDTSDPRLAQEGYMSCASCHLDGGQDGRVWDFTNMGEGMRNTIDLNGRGVGHGPAHWTANFDESQDFEGQIRSFASGTGLMSNAVFHYGSRSLPLGESKTGLSSDLDALAAYISSLTATGRSPYRNGDGSLTTSATAGREIFRQENCASCHGGSTFTDSSSMLRHDVGTLTSASGARLGLAIDGLDTPTLRGLWKSEPYLHDGSANTLRDVFVSRDLSGRHAGLFHRSESEIGQLMEYLLSIDDLETTAPTTATGSGPLVTSPGSQSSEIYRGLTLALTATGSGLTWQALALPPGLELDVVNGVIRGAPSQVGTYTARVAVRDAAGRSSVVSFPWIVTNPSARRYVKLVSLSTHNGGLYTSMAEFNLLGANGMPLDRGNWTVSANSQELSSADNAAVNVIDGSNSTIWHTRWSGLAFPHWLVVDLGNAEVITGFTSLPRQDGSGNGRIKGYEFYWSDDGVTWGSPVAQGQFPDSGSLQTVMLPGAGTTNLPPVFATPPTLSVTENSVVNTVVGTLGATDPNGGQTVSYSLGSGNIGGAFTIHASTGVIRVNGAIDYEQRPIYYLQVIATDNGTTPMSTALVVPIAVNNVIETNGEAVQLALTGAGGAFPGHGNPALVDFDADPDKDGIKNAVEILLGTDPNEANAQPPVRIGSVQQSGKTYLTYEYDVVDGSGLILRCFGSSNLVQWDEFTQVPVLIGTGNGLRTYRVRDDVALQDASKRFMRIRVDAEENVD